MIDIFDMVKSFDANIITVAGGVTATAGGLTATAGNITASDGVLSVTDDVNSNIATFHQGFKRLPWSAFTVLLSVQVCFSSYLYLVKYPQK